LKICALTDTYMSVLMAKVASCKYHIYSTEYASVPGNSLHLYDECIITCKRTDEQTYTYLNTCGAQELTLHLSIYTMISI